MTPIRDFALTYCVNSLWQVPVFAAAAWALDRLSRSADILRYRVWVASLVLAVCAPAAPCYRWLSGRHTLPGDPALGLAHIRIFMAQIATPSPGHILDAVAFVYLCACAGCAWQLIASMRGTSKLLRGAVTPHLSPEARAAWLLCVARFGLHDVRLLTSELIAGPATSGLRHPAILLPPRLLNDAPPQDLIAALAHEAAHIRRCDFGWNLFYEWLTVPLAWHPAARYLRMGIARNRELICDRIAVDTMHGAVLSPDLHSFDRNTYAQALLRLSSVATPPSHATTAVGIFDGDILETRIMTITRPNRPLRPMARRMLFAAALCLLTAEASVTTGFGLSFQSDTPASSLGPVYKPGSGIQNPKLISSVDPAFPKNANVGKTFSGISVIGIVVDRRGLPRDLHVIRSLTPAFDAEAMKAIRQYRFQPAMKDGQPVAAAITIEVNFQRF